MNAAGERRADLGRARLMLLFAPELVPAGSDPLEVLEAALPHVDCVQVRVKAPGQRAGPSPARELYDWTLRILETFTGRAGLPPVLVNDRVDVAAALLERGCAGAHLGQDDCEVELARSVLGTAPLLGLSTHDARQVAAAQRQPLDYVGFGPVFATPTKGYGRGLGPEAAWVAHTASTLPVFPIGGIDLESAAELAPVGRAAVSSAVLAAPDPERAARELRALLG